MCGGGVAAVEAVLALRELLALRPHIDLIAPNRDFVYAPMAVAQSFDLAETTLFELAELAEDLDVTLHADSLARVDAAEHRVVLADGPPISYDAAVIAVGARHRAWLEGATSFGGGEDAAAFAGLLERLERGETSRLAFVASPRASWTLPLYELALLTSSRLAERGVGGVELTILTPEADPLAIFGAGTSRMLRDQLADRGIRLRVGAIVDALGRGRLELDGGKVLEVDEVVALPVPEGPRVEGLPADAEGFIRVDDHCRVEGLQDVYAAGDGTDFPIKQGGLATQQADVAAESIAAGLGAPLEPSAFEPMLRGMLLTGIAPMYLRASADAAGGRNGELAANALWWPPTKIAGRYLGPYLAYASRLDKHTMLEDRPVSTLDPDALHASQDEARELALVFADADARGGDFRSALGWLELLERLDGVLPAGYVERREAWRAHISR